MSRLRERRWRVGLGVAATALTALAAGVLLMAGKGEPEGAPLPEANAAPGPPAASADRVARTGWSTAPEPHAAVAEALERAERDGESGPPGLVVLFATAGSDLPAIHAALHDHLGPEVKLYGGTSDSRWVMTEDRFVRAAEQGYQADTSQARRALALMCIRSEQITFGVGSADFRRHASVREAGRAAAAQALRSAGASPRDRPDVVLLTPTIGEEEEVLLGIEDVLGKETVVLGGTAGGPESGVFGEDGTYAEGVSLAVVFTDLPVGWAFEAGFDVTAPASGIVTEADGQAVVAIDGRPALDVYNEWLDGKIDRLFREVGDPSVIRDLLVLHPLYRRYRSPSGQDYFLFSHPWPRDPALKDRAVSTSTRIREGERVYLSQGSWGTLVNRIGNLPQRAKVQGEIGVSERPLFAIGYLCAGVVGIVPDGEQPKLAPLINYANNDGQFIANFTWGEQGHFPGIGNKHGNLSTGFLVVGRSE